MNTPMCLCVDLVLWPAPTKKTVSSNSQKDRAFSFLGSSRFSMSRLVLLLIALPSLLSLSFPEVSSSSSSSTSGSRSILREISGKEGGGGGGEAHEYAVDVNETNFDSVLGDTPATYAIVEFFAHWCPTCRNYKPHYEKVAKLFNGPSAAHPGILLMARVDCASKINTKLCNKFSVDHYPMLFWGPPSKFVAGSWEPKQDKSEIHVIDDFRTADRLINWINKQMGSSYGLDDQKFENVHPSNISDFGQIARAVFDVEEATTTAFDIILQQKMIKPQTRASLIKFLQLLVVHHPSKRCRKGSADILVDFDDLFLSDTPSNDKLEDVDNKKAALGNLQICGKEVPRGYWMFCRGSRNDTRGFSCGLWVLMHSLSVRIEDGESQVAFTAICDFIHNFFICEECRQHFYEMCSSVSAPFSKARDLTLWLWRAHNQVNERLTKEEAYLGTGDPNFPKIVWPPKQLCPSCSRGNADRNNKADWDEDEVFKFLTSYYGKTLVSLNKNKALETEGTNKALEDTAAASTHALAVPLGAALAIAVASCAFLALACYWRSRQKNQKQRRSWN